jgi:hypothetical protein
LVWFQALRASNGLSTWYEFLRAIQARFSPKCQEQQEKARASHIDIESMEFEKMHPVPEKVESQEKFKNGEEEKRDEEAKHTMIQETDPVEDTYQLFDEIPQPRISESIVVKIFQDRDGLYQDEENMFDERMDPKFELRHTISGKQNVAWAENLVWAIDSCLA